MKNGDVEEEGEMKGALGKRKRGGGGVLGGGESMIVFCNTVGCCRSLDHTLREWGVKPSHYHSKMVCFLLFLFFCDAFSYSFFFFQPRALQKEEYEKFLSGRTNILLTTDLASRGLDTTNVKHIINFDFPRSPIDYLHRCSFLFFIFYFFYFLFFYFYFYFLEYFLTFPPHNLFIISTTTKNAHIYIISRKNRKNEHPRKSH